MNFWNWHIFNKPKSTPQIRVNKTNPVEDRNEIVINYICLYMNDWNGLRKKRKSEV